jgi:hypothetical protein
MSFGMRILGAITPHRGQGLREKVTPQRLFLLVKIQSVIATARIMTSRPIKEKASALNESVPYSGRQTSPLPYRMVRPGYKQGR